MTFSEALKEVNAPSVAFLFRKVQEAREEKDTKKECRAIRDLFEELAKLSDERDSTEKNRNGKAFFSAVKVVLETLK